MLELFPFLEKSDTPARSEPVLRQDSKIQAAFDPLRQERVEPTYTTAPADSTVANDPFELPSGKISLDEF